MSIHYTTADEPARSPSNKDDVCLVGDCLMVPTNYKFPKICIFSGLEVDGPPEGHWMEASRTSGDPFLSVEVTRRVKVFYYVHPSIVKKRWGKRLITLGLTFTGAAAGVWVISRTSGNPLYFALVAAPFVLGAFWHHRKMGFALHAKSVSQNYVTIAGIPKVVREAIYEAGR